MLFEFVTILTTLSTIISLAQTTRVPPPQTAPFTSRIDPPFPLIVHYVRYKQTKDPEINGRFSDHNVTINFTTCYFHYLWPGHGRITIALVKNDQLIVLHRIEPNPNQPTPCVVVSQLRLSYNFNGYPLSIFYRKFGLDLLEKSFIINFLFSSLILTFDKLSYEINDRIVVRCSIISPISIANGRELTILPSDPNIRIIKYDRLQNDHVLELIGRLNTLVVDLNFTCFFSNLFVSNQAALEKTVKTKPIFVINRSDLATALGLFLMVLIVMGIYALVFVRTGRLTADITAYHTEMTEDKTVRFADPILNNLTSPKRRFSLPGLFAAYQLRRNFRNLIEKLLSFYPKPKLRSELQTQPIFGRETSEFCRKFNPLLTSNLRDRVIIGLGPKPQKAVKPKQESSVEETESKESSLASSSEVESELLRKVDSSISLDPRIISSLPYVRIAHEDQKPYWSVKDSTIGIPHSITDKKQKK